MSCQISNFYEKKNTLNPLLKSFPNRFKTYSIESSIKKNDKTYVKNNKSKICTKMKSTPRTMISIIDFKRISYLFSLVIKIPYRKTITWYHTIGQPNEWWKTIGRWIQWVMYKQANNYTWKTPMNKNKGGLSKLPRLTRNLHVFPQKGKEESTRKFHEW